MSWFLNPYEAKFEFVNENVMRKILIPADFSNNAFNALKYACQVFKYERAEFLIMHAYADEVYRQASVLGLGDLKETLLQDSEKQLKTMKNQLMEYSPNPKHVYSYISVFASLVDATNDLVNKENIDIVVMGTRGETNDRSLTFGSNTLHVLKYVHCPVLAIPESYEYHAPKQMLFPTNYMVPYKRRELKLLCQMAVSFRSKIHLLYIDANKKLSPRQEDNKRFLSDSLQEPELFFEKTVEKDKTMAITKYIVHNSIDLLVIVNSRHSYLEDLLHQSTIDQLGLHVKIPFLVLQNIAR